MSNEKPPLAPPSPLAAIAWCSGLSVTSMGAIAPFVAREIRAAGWTGPAFAAVMGWYALTRLPLSPLLGWLGDRYRAEHRILQACSILCLSAMLLVTAGPATLVPGFVLLAVGRVGLTSNLDGLTLKALGKDGMGYGRIRRWGSLGYLLMAATAPWLAAHGARSPLAVGLALTAVLVASTFRVGPVGLDAPPARRVPFHELLKSPLIRGTLAVGMLHFAAHAIYDWYFTLHTDRLGVSLELAGLAVAAGVALEVAVLSWSQALLRRFDAPTLLALSTWLSVPRWWLTAVATAPALVLGVQVLHGITLGLAWAASVAILWTESPPEYRSSAQGLLGAAVGGVGTLLGTVSGALLSERPSDAFLAAAAMALVASVLAGWTAWRGRLVPGPLESRP